MDVVNHVYTVHFHTIALNTNIIKLAKYLQINKLVTI